MAVKRSSDAAEDEKPSKQTKLEFGRKTSSKIPTTSSKAENAKRNNGSNASGSSKKTSTFEAPPRAKNGFELSEISGDIFDAPDGTVIIHACNCVGSWSAGIAAAFKTRYPNAFKEYEKHCKKSKTVDLIQTALLIPPQDGSPKHYVGCLFTSKIYGRRKDSPKQIIEATAPAMKDLIDQMNEAGEDIKQIRICQINSGLFNVPWERSRAVLESIEVEDSQNTKIPKEIIVYSLPEK